MSPEGSDGSGGVLSFDVFPLRKRSTKTKYMTESRQS
jgi:hypothetical protein